MAWLGKSSRKPFSSFSWGLLVLQWYGRLGRRGGKGGPFVAIGQEEKQVPSQLCIPAFAKGDEFKFSLSEFVEPALLIRYLKAKGGYLLFEYPPDVTGEIRLEMRVFFTGRLEKYGATISFSGLVYRIFEESQLGYPALIVKVPSFFTYRQEKRADPRVAMDLPLRFWRTGSFKRGTVENLSIGGARFSTPEPKSLKANDVVNMDIEDGRLKLGKPLQARVLRVDLRKGQDAIVAVEFLDMDASDREKLDLFVNQQLMA